MSMPFTRLTGAAAPLLRANIDTDAIIPSRETKSVSRDGYGEKLFANWRYEPGTRIENPDFVLNKPQYKNARILLAGPNFGCGSSREAAAWSLVQYGIRCVIASSFGAIFRNNSVRNGLLPVVLKASEVSALAADREQSTSKDITVDLETCSVETDSGLRFSFTMPPRDRQMLLTGLDEIELTLKLLPQIRAFREVDRARRPWIYNRPE